PRPRPRRRDGLAGGAARAPDRQKAPVTRGFFQLTDTTPARSIFPAHGIGTPIEAPVHAELDRVLGQVVLPAAIGEREDEARIPEVVVEVFGLDRHVRRDAPFDARA